MTARVTLRRPWWPPGDFFCAYRVFVDRAQVGSIRRRETKTFDVEPGPHEVYLELDWCSSKVLDVVLSPGQDVRLVCKAKNPLGGWNAFTNKRNYMTLDFDGQPDTAPS